jgi:hypothetical protein
MSSVSSQVNQSSNVRYDTQQDTPHIEVVSFIDTTSFLIANPAADLYNSSQYQKALDTATNIIKSNDPAQVFISYYISGLSRYQLSRLISVTKNVTEGGCCCFNGTTRVYPDHNATLKQRTELIAGAIHDLTKSFELSCSHYFDNNQGQLRGLEKLRSDISCCLAAALKGDYLETYR